jgi:hypothetical protein
VLVQGGVIAYRGRERPPSARPSSTSGTLLPGLIDAHVHLSEDLDADLRQSAALGVTTVLDMWNGGTRYEHQDHSSQRPSGMATCWPESAPRRRRAPVPDGRSTVPTITDSADAPTFVDAHSRRIRLHQDHLRRSRVDAEAGSDAVSKHAGGTNCCARAGQAGGGAYPFRAQARDAIEAGADRLVHLFNADSVTPGFAGLVERHHAFVIPTLTVWSACAASRSARDGGRFLLGLDPSRVAPGDGSPSMAPRDTVSAWEPTGHSSAGPAQGAGPPGRRPGPGADLRRVGPWRACSLVDAGMSPAGRSRPPRGARAPFAHRSGTDQPGLGPIWSW